MYIQFTEQHESYPSELVLVPWFGDKHWISANMANIDIFANY